MPFPTLNAQLCYKRVKGSFLVHAVLLTVRGDGVAILRRTGPVVLREKPRQCSLALFPRGTRTVQKCVLLVSASYGRNIPWIVKVLSSNSQVLACFGRLQEVSALIHSAL